MTERKIERLLQEADEATFFPPVLIIALNT